ncbi:MULTISPECIES: cytochrome P450 family protein [Streptomyces]|uniref:Cytochrome P450 n=1 Tax=Streptomyces eurythermus TaxID=42237 RepID=A0ABW6Z7L7_9ACTN|nr:MULTISPECIES: cytochrome P450 [Streptomyces]
MSVIPFSATPTETLDNKGGRCMYAQVERLRSLGPAVPVQLPEGVAAWSVSRGDVVRMLLTHPGVSRDLKKTVPAYQPGSVPWLSPWVDLDSMATADGREHARLRKLITPAFTPRRVERLRSHIEADVTMLLDQLATRPADEPVDLHQEFSYSVPTQVICDLFGIPDDQRPEVLRVFREVARTGLSEEESVALYNDLVAAMHLLITTKRTAPADDLTSFLLAAREEGEESLNEHELVSTLLLMIGGGSQTTINLLDHTIRELLARPDQLSILRADPERWDDAVEESLRVHCPVMHLPMRWAKEDIDLGEGVVIRAGDAILICYGAHGRDPGVHRDPETFDIDREDKDHIAFGLGAHFCPGSHLARLEARIALPALFDRFPRLALAVDPEDVPPGQTFIGNDVSSLPVFLRHK